MGETDKGLDDGKEKDQIRDTKLPAATLWVLPANLPPSERNMLRSDSLTTNQTPQVKTNTYNESENSTLKESSTDWVVVKKVKRYFTQLWWLNEPKDHNENSKFCNVIRAILIAGQAFALMPVIGVTNKSPGKLRFSWLSWRLVYSVLSGAGIGILACLSAYRLSLNGLSFHKSTSVIFYACTASVTFMFLKLAVRWPKLVQQITSTEDALAQIGGSGNLERRVKTIGFGVLLLALSKLLALIEHILSIMAGVQVAKDCNPDMNRFEAYFTHSFPQVFNLTTFTYWKATAVQFLNLQSTFNWNFMDVFIIVVSCYLTEKFEEVNTRLKSVQKKYLPEKFWKSAREDFARLSLLVKVVDGGINEIVFLSFANNLYFICLQLFNSLNDGLPTQRTYVQNGNETGPLGGYEHAVYFTFSFAFLVGRTLAVSLYASKVYTVSKQPANVLYAVPTATYRTEVDRFLQQVISDNIALTGMGFFNVTRGLVLTVAGTIVTYELVLVQFNSTGNVEAQDMECHAYIVKA